VLLQSSFFYYILDYKLDANLSDPSKSYLDYLVEYYREDIPEWQEFESTFRLWAIEAKRLAPRVVVLLCPALHLPESHRVDGIYEKVRRLCYELDMEMINLNDDLHDLRRNRMAVSATPDMIHTQTQWFTSA
jgi:hypothetical protein